MGPDGDSGERGLFQVNNPYDQIRQLRAEKNGYRSALEQIAVSAPDADLRRIARDAIRHGSKPETVVMRSSLSPPDRRFPWLSMHFDAARVVVAVAIVPRWMRLTLVEAMRSTYSGGKYGTAEFDLEDEGLRRK